MKLSKPFSTMTEQEKHVNRERLRHGLSADWIEETDAMKMTDAERRAALEELARQRRAAQQAAKLAYFLSTRNKS